MNFAYIKCEDYYGCGNSAGFAPVSPFKEQRLRKWISRRAAHPKAEYKDAVKKIKIGK